MAAKVLYSAFTEAGLSGKDPNSNKSLGNDCTQMHTNTPHSMSYDYTHLEYFLQTQQKHDFQSLTIYMQPCMLVLVFLNLIQ